MNNYEVPELEIVRFDAEDVIVTSNGIPPYIPSDPDELPIL